MTREKRKQVTKRYYESHKEQLREKNAEYRRKLREFALQRYGGVCFCCGEARYQFLAIDHIAGNGNNHRKEISGRINFGGYGFLLWLQRNNWPEGFQVACHNCNMARAFFGVCPHELERQERA